jgi:hypothetical protein
VGREELFSVTLYRGDEQDPVSLELYGYDSSQCLCVVGGEQTMVVSRETAEALTDQITRILVVE